MMVDTRVYAFVTDGAVYHPACAPDGLTTSEPEVDAVFSYDDDGEGLTCDGCGRFIFEPDEPEADEEFVEPDRVADIEAESYTFNF